MKKQRLAEEKERQKNKESARKEDDEISLNHQVARNRMVNKGNNNVILNENNNSQRKKTQVSETTIYDQAVNKESEQIIKGKGRMSSSSEEGETSGDNSDNIEDLITQFIGSQRIEAEKGRDNRNRDRYRDDRRDKYDDGARPHCSKDDDRREAERIRTERIIQDKAKQLVREAERTKGRILDVAGKDTMKQAENFDRSTAYALLLDDSYRTVASHVDENTMNKIKEGMYVDFARLLSKDRIEEDEEQRMVMVSKGGMTYYVPASDRDKFSISSISKWEAAFRVYSQIYLGFFPNRATELNEYAHTIHSIAQEFVWSNMYRYDKEFRLHMELHPERSWSVILQKAWSLFLKMRLTQGQSQGQGQSISTYQTERNGNGNERKKSKICYKYNKGNCMYGMNCKFEHKCSLCFKHGHGSHICRRGALNERRNREKDRETGENWYKQYHRSDRNGRRR